MVATEGRDASTFGSSTYSRKLQTKIDKLDPTERLAISDWLISFRAAAGAAFTEFFEDVQLGGAAETLDEFRAQLRARHPARSAEIDAIPDDEMLEQCAATLETALANDRQIRDWLINNVAWQKCPELKRRIRGSGAPDDPGFAKDDKGGTRFYNWLLERGGVAAPEVQKSLTADWATLFAEAHLSKMGKGRTIQIFSDVTSCDAVIKDEQNNSIYFSNT